MVVAIFAFLTAIMPAVMEGIKLFLANQQHKEQETDALIERDVSVWGGPPTDGVLPTKIL